MSTKNEWREKYIKLLGTKIVGYDDVFDFCYSLHTEKIAEIREAISKLEPGGIVEPGRINLIRTEEVLSLLTDETI